MQRLQSLGQWLGLEEHLHIGTSTCLAQARGSCAALLTHFSNSGVEEQQEAAH